jgi:gluconolactonase
VIADSYDGKRLNSPNDVVVKSDGSIWFTDPTYGIMSDYEGFKADPEQAVCHVFRTDPATGETTVVADDFVKPNGLAFSPDETILYVSDSGLSHDPAGPHHIRAFDVADGRKLTNGARLRRDLARACPTAFAATPTATCGRAPRTACCYAPDGTLLGRIRIPHHGLQPDVWRRSATACSSPPPTRSIPSSSPPAGAQTP